MSHAEFLLEVGIEEIPHWMIPGALDDLRRRFLDALEQHGLAAGVDCRTGGTPRRMMLLAENVPARQPDKRETVTGPPKNVAFDAEGKPTKAAVGFAKRVGLAVEQLVLGGDGRLSVERTLEGRATVDILAEVLPGVVLGVSFPKNMYWTGKGGPRYIRPIRWLVALFAGNVTPFEIAGVKSSKVTYGHRRLGPGPLEVTSGESYIESLRKNYVLVAAPDRREKIEREIAALLPQGARLRSNPKLLETLVFLTEWPTPILGSFDESYLSLPEEVLETVMLHHQNYFALEDEGGRLKPAFIAVANLDGDPDGVIRQGNERVLRARFNDARFFWEGDQKRTLAERVEDLKAVTFQAKLGSYFDKTERNRRLAAALAESLALEAGLRRHIDRAAGLAKCDLTTGMVGEFPELQGVMGGLYARAQGEPHEVAGAIYDHYRPAGADDAIPRGVVGQIVAAADKLDILGGFFRLGMIPSGSRDPFALRRAAYGIIRILIEGGLRLTLARLVELAGAEHAAAALREFFIERLRYYLSEVRGCRYDEINAVLSASAEEPADAAARAEAIAKVRATPNFEPLAVSFKRIENILKKAGGVETYAARELDAKLLEGGAERDLYDAAEKLRPAIEEHRRKRDYAPALEAIATLRPAVDRFFDDVLVMTPDEQIRNNRLTFLAKLLREMSTIANFAEIVSAEAGS